MSPRRFSGWVDAGSSSQFQYDSFSRCKPEIAVSCSPISSGIVLEARGNRTSWKITSSPSLLRRVGRESPSAFGSTSDNHVAVNSGAISRSVSSEIGGLPVARADRPERGDWTPASWR